MQMIVRLSKEYRDRYRNQETVADLNGDWHIESEWTESTGEARVRIRRGDQTRDIPKKFVKLKK